MANPVQTPDTLTQPQRLEDLLLYRMSVVTRSASLPMVRYFEGELGITRRHWHVLALVVGHGGLRPSQIATLCWLDRPQVSRALSGLLQQGLVERPKDGASRTQQVVATARGLALYAQAFARVAAFNADLVRVLDASQRQVLDGLLTMLQQHGQALSSQVAAAAPPVQRSRGGRKGDPVRAPWHASAPTHAPQPHNVACPPAGAPASEDGLPP